MARASQLTHVGELVEADLYAAREAAWRAFFAGDTRELMRSLPENFVGVGWGGGPWTNRAKVIADSRTFAVAGGKLLRLEFPRSEIQLFGDVAVIFSEYVAEVFSDGKTVTQTGRATEVFVKQGDGWIHPSWHLDSGL